MENEFNFGSLFSGIGGIDLGLERAGMTCKWQVEIDDFCTKILEKHWPEVRKYKDVREVGKHNLEPVDLITGGFPCQPHSVAGKRRGKDDDRNLWPEYLRIIREIRPRWVVGENVPGIITTILDDVLSDLESEGYTTTVFNIPACAFGANHIRYRIFVISYANDTRNRTSEHGNNGIQQKEIKGWKKRSFNKSCGQGEIVSNTMCKRPSECSARENNQERQSPCKKEQGDGNGIWPEIDGRGISLASQNMADTNMLTRGLSEQSREESSKISGGGKEDIDTRAIESGLGGMVDGISPELDENWRIEPDIPRVATGVKNRVDRLKSLGNAVVPQVAEYIGRCIMESENNARIL
jgi:DNA (cytosine-5)-methyltransferase 1